MLDAGAVGTLVLCQCSRGCYYVKSYISHSSVWLVVVWKLHLLSRY